MQQYNNNNQNNNNNNNNNMNYNNTYMNMLEAESSNASSEINIEDLPTSSSIMSPMMPSKDPSRSGPFMEDIQSIKCAPNVMSAACLHSITMGEKFGQYVRNDRIILCRQSTTNPAEIERYCNYISSNILSRMCLRTCETIQHPTYLL